MTADYAALEARVTELERQVRHVLSAKIDAVAYGLSLVHEDTRAIRAALDVQAATLAEHGETQRAHGVMLREILNRLPPPAE